MSDSLYVAPKDAAIHELLAALVRIDEYMSREQRELERAEELVARGRESIADLEQRRVALNAALDRLQS